MDLIDVLAAGGPVVVGGLGLAVASRLLGTSAPPALVLARRLQPVGALVAVGALALPEGVVAGVAALPWSVVGLCGAAAGLSLLGEVVPGEALRVGLVRWPLAVLTLAAALCHLAVGSGWLVASCLGLRPFGMSHDAVRVVAVHLHYAGFGTAVLAATGLACADWMASRVSLSVGSVTAAVGPPVVAVGLATGWPLPQLGGSVLLTVAAWAVGFGTFLLATSTSASGAAPATARGPVQALGRSLLVVSSLSSVVPMVLAVGWAVARHLAGPTLGTTDMAAAHGVLAAVGFVVVGLVGWLLAGISSPASGAARPPGGWPPPGAALPAGRPAAPPGRGSRPLRR
ncbi:MAG TPA: YndJ family transporter [Acidimicrobiales bacterium]|nr:YndJ family transporter [Acidimicrobiales bacterium]